jgi:hypothetical protein
VANPIQRRGEWWQEEPDGSWLKWSEEAGAWEPQQMPAPPPDQEEPQLEPEPMQTPAAGAVVAEADLWEKGRMLLAKGDEAQIVERLAVDRVRVRNSRGEEGVVYTEKLSFKQAPVSSGARPSTTPAASTTRTDQINGFAIAGLIAGVLGVAFGLGPAIAYILPLGCGAVAVLLGFLGRGRAKEMNSRTGMATAAILLGAIAVALGIAGAVIVEDATSDFEREIEEFERDFPGL